MTFSYKRKSPLDGGSELDLYCHGSLKNQAKTTVIAEGRDTKLKRLSLVCHDKQFVDVNTKVGINIENHSGKRLNGRRWSEWRRLPAAGDRSPG